MRRYITRLNYLGLVLSLVSSGVVLAEAPVLSSLTDESPQADSAVTETPAVEANPYGEMNDPASLEAPADALDLRQSAPRYPVSDHPYVDKLKQRFITPLSKPEQTLKQVNTPEAQALEAEVSGSVLVLPIYTVSHQQAFSDVPLLVAEQLTQSITRQHPGVVTLSPTDTLNTWRQNHVWPLYIKLVEQYQQTGFIHQATWNRLKGLALAKQTNIPPLSRLILVEGHINLLQPTKRVQDRWGKLNDWLKDDIAHEGQAFLETRTRVFRVDEWELFPLWEAQRQQPMSADKLGYVSPTLARNTQAKAVVQQATYELNTRLLEAAPIELLYDPVRANSTIRGRLSAEEQRAIESQAGVAQ